MRHGTLLSRAPLTRIIAASVSRSNCCPQLVRRERLGPANQFASPREENWDCYGKASTRDAAGTSGSARDSSSRRSAGHCGRALDGVFSGERPARLECRWQKAAIGERREDALIGALAGHAWFLPSCVAACCAPTTGKQQTPERDAAKHGRERLATRHQPTTSKP